ncbi:MAG: hypothetical protein ABIA08_01895 [bacterium]
MLEIIFAVIFFISFLGMGIIIYRKLPELVNLPEKSLASLGFKQMISELKESKSGSTASIELVLQKVLSRVRIVILKSDNKTSNWLQSLRQRSQKNKFSENDTYWKDVKKMTRKE